MKIKIDQHQEIGTWEPVQLPQDHKVIGCQWVFAVKTKPDGQFEKGKARVVAQGFTQRPGMDYYDITSPVIKFNSLQLLLAIANTLNWEIEMMDIIRTYLNSELEEEIYMKLPRGFNDRSGQVLKLHWAIYGLKQVGCAWYNWLRKTLLNLRYIQSITNECLYIQKGESGINIIAAYVDDLGLVSNTKTRMAKVKEELNKKLPITDLGEMKILGVKVGIS